MIRYITSAELNPFGCSSTLRRADNLYHTFVVPRGFVARISTFPGCALFVTNVRNAQCPLGEIVVFVMLASVCRTANVVFSRFSPCTSSNESGSCVNQFGGSIFVITGFALCARQAVTQSHCATNPTANKPKPRSIEHFLTRMLLHKSFNLPVRALSCKEERERMRHDNLHRGAFLKTTG